MQALEGVKEPNAPERPGRSASPTAHPCNCVRNSRNNLAVAGGRLALATTRVTRVRESGEQFLVASASRKSDTALAASRGTAYLSVCLYWLATLKTQVQVSK